jgi:superfamily II DNA or RNA helicase
VQIVKERSRLIFTDYSPTEKRAIEKLVSTEEKIFTFEDPDKQTIYLPTGMEHAVKTQLRHPIVYKTAPWPAKQAKPSGSGHFEPRNQMQIDAIKFALACAKKLTPLVGFILPPGAGKTFMASYCAVKVGLKTLIITPTSGIRDQWAEALHTMMMVPRENITIATSARSFIETNADYIVTLQPTIANINKNFDLEKLLKDKQFGIKIIDECQMFFHNIIRVDGCSNFAHNWYLTGTFGRSGEEENALYQKMFGEIKLFTVPDKKPTIFNRKPGDIYGQKPHMHCDMYWMKSGLTKEQAASVAKSTKYGVSVPKYTELVIPSDGRVTVFVQKVLEIVKRAEKRTPYGSMLLLTPTIKSVEIMATHLRRAFPSKKIMTIHSGISKDEIARAKAEADIIVSTVKSAGTGFDVPTLSKLVVTEQFKSWILTDQVSGRLRRRPDGKDTYMYDIVDRSVKQLRLWGKARSEILRRKSKKFTVRDI